MTETYRERMHPSDGGSGGCRVAGSLIEDVGRAVDALVIEGYPPEFAPGSA